MVLSENCEIFYVLTSIRLRGSCFGELRSHQGDAVIWVNEILTTYCNIWNSCRFQCSQPGAWKICDTISYVWSAKPWYEQNRRFSLRWEKNNLLCSKLQLLNNVSFLKKQSCSPSFMKTEVINKHLSVITATNFCIFCMTENMFQVQGLLQDLHCILSVVK